MPPSPAPSDDLFVSVSLTAVPLDIADALAVAAGRDGACGAVASFVGVTRNTFGGRAVVRLEYEAHERMAVAELDRVARRAAAAAGGAGAGGGVRRLVVAHRVGVVPVGEPSVIVAAAAPHRGPALEVVRLALDALKATVPIWKREVYADAGGGAGGGGDAHAVWKANPECPWGGGGPAPAPG